MADRKQLLDEMAARFNPGECVVLRRDLETVQQVLTTQWAEFEELLAVCQVLCKIAGSGCSFGAAGIVSLLNVRLRMTA